MNAAVQLTKMTRSVLAFEGALPRACLRVWKEPVVALNGKAFHLTKGYTTMEMAAKSLVSKLRSGAHNPMGKTGSLRAWG